MWAYHSDIYEAMSKAAQLIITNYWKLLRYRSSEESIKLCYFLLNLILIN